MYAKSIIERAAHAVHARGRLTARAWTPHLHLVPVVMALAVAALPFMLEPRFESLAATGAVVADVPAVETPATNLVKTAFGSFGTLGALGTYPPNLVADDRRHAIVAEYMARRFFVSRQAVLDLIKTAHAAGRQYNIDPMLLVAVIAVESSFNPIAESVAGAKGLMQIIPHYHLEKFTEFGGEQAVFEPRVNIAVGARIIREYLHAASGNLFTAMQTYAGALPDRDASYTHKVLNEKDRLDAIMGLPKSDRGGYVAHSSALPAAPALLPLRPAPDGRVQMIIPAPAAPAPQPGAPQPDALAKPAEPLATLPLNLAAVRPAP